MRFLNSMRVPWMSLLSAMLLWGCTPTQVVDAGTDVPSLEAEASVSDVADVGAETGPSCGRTTPNWGRGGEFMLPGTDCLDCHKSGGAAQRAFSIAGTVFRTRECPEAFPSAIVHVIDSADASLALPTNEEGNFYSAATLVAPYRVSVTWDGGSAQMNGDVRNGSCSRCHTSGSRVGPLAPQ